MEANKSQLYSSGIPKSTSGFMMPPGMASGISDVKPRPLKELKF